MATITITQAIFQTAGDLSDKLALDVHTLDAADGWDAQRRTYASGRLRLITGDTTSQDITVQLKNMSKANRQALRDRGGKLQLLRLPEGYKRYGVFDARQVTEQTSLSRSDVTLTFQEITVDENVEV